MRLCSDNNMHSLILKAVSLAFAAPISILATSAIPLELTPAQHHYDNDTISPQLFNELEELARVVDISYCVGTTGIQKPFECVSRCHEFESFELVSVSAVSMVSSSPSCR